MAFEKRDRLIGHPPRLVNAFVERIRDAAALVVPALVLLVRIAAGHLAGKPFLVIVERVGVFEARLDQHNGLVAVRVARRREMLFAYSMSAIAGFREEARFLDSEALRDGRVAEDAVPPR